VIRARVFGVFLGSHSFIASLSVNTESIDLLRDHSGCKVHRRLLRGSKTYFS